MLILFWRRNKIMIPENKYCDRKIGWVRVPHRLPEFYFSRFLFFDLLIKFGKIIKKVRANLIEIQIDI